jgi:hypothetical protein
MFIIASLAWLFGSSAAALMIATGNLLAFTFAILLAWRKFGRHIWPARGSAIKALMVQKLKLYSRLLLGKTASAWIRTERRKSK